MHGHCTWNYGPMNAHPGTCQGFDGFNEFEAYDWNNNQAGWMGPFGGAGWMDMNPIAMMNAWNEMRSWHQRAQWMNMNPWAYMNQWNPMNRAPGNWSVLGNWAPGNWATPGNWTAPGHPATPDWNRSSWKPNSGFTSSGFENTSGFGGSTPPAEAA